MGRLLAFYAAALAVTGCTNEVEVGRASYAELCAGCHGPVGKGDGAAGIGLAPAPADLTRIAARNDGTFSRVAVMARIDGYARGEAHPGAMPAFWPLLEGRTVLVETAPGVLTPTPEPLVALAAYLESIQE